MRVYPSWFPLETKICFTLVISVIIFWGSGVAALWFVLHMATGYYVWTSLVGGLYTFFGLNSLDHLFKRVIDGYRNHKDFRSAWKMLSIIGAIETGEMARIAFNVGLNSALIGWLMFILSGFTPFVTFAYFAII
jgi:hypothetical protein